jgi:hypothetical protein
MDPANECSWTQYFDDNDTNGSHHPFLTKFQAQLTSTSPQKRLFSSRLLLGSSFFSSSVLKSLRLNEALSFECCSNAIRVDMMDVVATVDVCYADTDDSCVIEWNLS